MLLLRNEIVKTAVVIEGDSDDSSRRTLASFDSFDFLFLIKNHCSILTAKWIPRTAPTCPRILRILRGKGDYETRTQSSDIVGWEERRRREEKKRDSSSQIREICRGVEDSQYPRRNKKPSPPSRGGSISTYISRKPITSRFDLIPSMPLNFLLTQRRYAVDRDGIRSNRGGRGGEEERRK